MPKEEEKRTQTSVNDQGGRAQAPISRLHDSTNLMRITASSSSNVSIATSQGNREHQEDRFVDELVLMRSVKNGKGQLMAVLDGHGGYDASDKVSKSIFGVFHVALAMSKGNVMLALKDTVSKLAWIVDDKDSGTTLSVVYVPKNRRRAYVAVIGDSPVIILDKDNKILLSPEHNVRTNPAELERAKKKGAIYDGNGYIMEPNGFGGLQMSRALGDRMLSGILDHNADVYSAELGRKSFIILGSDGLVDPTHQNTAVQVRRVVDLVQKGGEASDLVKDALDRQTGDNATAIVWRPR